MTLTEHIVALVQERENALDRMNAALNRGAEVTAEHHRGKSIGLAMGIAALRDLEVKQ